MAHVQAGLWGCRAARRWTHGAAVGGLRSGAPPLAVPEGLCATRPVELVREFIHDCLYNGQTGYFQKNVNILSTAAEDEQGGPIAFAALASQEAYLRLLGRAYEAQTRQSHFYQLWHTPSVLFRPWYGRAMARYIEQAFGSLVRRAGGGAPHEAPSLPLVIYEVGPGNGALAEDVLTYFGEVLPPAAFAAIEYHMIEVSGHLVETHLRALQAKFPRHIRLHQTSFLEWEGVEERPAFVIATEVFDNLCQDRVKFSRPAGDLLQGVVVTNDAATYGEAQARYTELFVPATDAAIVETVNALDEVGFRWRSLRANLGESLSSVWPFSLFEVGTPWSTEFIPTGQYAFLKRLRRSHPRHCFIMTDFDELPDTIAGYGGPVVQTRYGGDTVACSTYLLERGLFDIFFPTNFATLAALYGRLFPAAPAAVLLKHAAFVRAHGQVEGTRTRSGYNPMVEDFENVSFLIAKTAPFC